MDKSVRKFIIDTDCGIDDAGAILIAAEAHKRGEIKIMGITTVYGNTTLDNVNRNVARTLEIAKCSDIPIYPGASEGMVMKYTRVNQIHHENGFGGAEFDSEPDLSPLKKEHAVDFIRRMIMEHEDEITLVTLGPLTNVALAFKTDIGLSKKIKEMVVMGGNTQALGNITTCAEFNFHCDPEAAYAVLDVVQCPVLLIELYVCAFRAAVEVEWMIETAYNINTPESKLMQKIEKPWVDIAISLGKKMSMYDQLAMAVAIDRKIIKTSKKEMATVELSGFQTRGQMILERRLKAIVQPDFIPNVELIEEIDLDLFKRHLLRSLGHKNVF